MRILLLLATHLMISVPSALVVALQFDTGFADARPLWGLAIASALFCAAGLTATVMYLGKRFKPLSVVAAGYLCGILCGAMLGLILAGTNYSLVVYLALLAPTLLAVLLASLLERSRSGWAP